MFHEICGTVKAEPDLYRLDSIQLTIHAHQAKVYHDTIVADPHRAAFMAVKITTTHLTAIAQPVASNLTEVSYDSCECNSFRHQFSRVVVLHD